MTVEVFTPAPIYTVAGIGPYAIPHPYVAGAIRAYVTVDGVEVALEAGSISVAPSAAPIAGDLYLSPVAAGIHAGQALRIERDTTAEQGWLGVQGEREKGLETQLDRLTYVVQELEVQAGRTLRVREGIPGFVPEGTGTELVAFVDGVPQTLPAEEFRGPRGIQGVPGPVSTVPGPRGLQGIQGVKGDPGSYLGLNLIGASTNILDRPVSASNGDAWGLIGTGVLTIYVYAAGVWSYVGPVTSPEAVPVAGTIFVGKQGNDANSGTTQGTAVLTIARALVLTAARAQPTLIEIGPGDYEVQGNLDLPDDTAIRAVYRTVKVIPAPGFELRNVFRLGNGCFVEGVIVEGFRMDDLDAPTVGFAFSFRPGAVISRPPYIHKCAVRAVQPAQFIGPTLDPLNGNPGWPIGPGVVLADGLVASQYSIFPNILTWGATPVGYNGGGYRARNGGLIHAVGAVGMWSHKHFVAESGGKIQLSGCETQFGDFSLVADGSRTIVQPRQMTAALTVETAAATAIFAARATLIDAMWTGLVTGSFTTGWTAEDEAFTRFDAAVWLSAVEHMLNGAASDPIERFQKVMFDVTGAPVFAAPKLAAFVASFNLLRDGMQALVGVGAAADAMIADATAKLNDTLNTPILSIERSVVESINHKWTGQGAGVWAIKAPPIRARWTIRQSILETNGGVVIATGQDSDRNGELGGDVRIDARFGLTGSGFISPVRREATRAAIIFGGF